MRKDYKPDYVPGEILVCPLDDSDFTSAYDLPASYFLGIDEDFFRSVGMLQGYSLKGEHESLERVYVFEVPLGKEEDAIKYFKNLEIRLSSSKKISVVGWAQKRDLRWEKRRNSLEELSNIVEELSEDVDENLSKGEYNKRLDQIMDCAKSIKENK